MPTCADALFQYVLRFNVGKSATESGAKLQINSHICKIKLSFVLIYCEYLYEQPLDDSDAPRKYSR